MFSTCLFCHASLGRNDAIEHFPVGRRLAFDGERGRLWAVCPRCARWNLAPIEARWEALEGCERAYREARQRVSTDNIALARLRDGTDLVRIGRPLLPEFAAWRYGQELRRRAQRTIAVSATIGGASIVANGSTILAGASMVGSTAVVVGAVPALVQVAFVAWVLQRRMPRVVTREVDGHLWGVSAAEVWESRVGLTPDQRLRVTMRERPLRGPSVFNRLLRAPYGWDTSSAREPAPRDVVGDDAVRLLQVALPVAHREGGSRAQVRAAVETLEAGWRGRDAPVEEVVARWLASPTDGPSTRGTSAGDRAVQFIPAPVRLAAEMALHEDDERRALAGELGALYARWEEAERIARLADGELTRLVDGERR